MNQLFFLELISITLASISLDFSKQCSCTAYGVMQDCDVSAKCFWENSEQQCKSKTCATYINQADCGQQNNCQWSTTCSDFVNKCSDYNTETKCDQLSSIYNCAWNGEQCANFTSCSDYIPGKTGCISKSSSTQNCQSNDTGTACENAPTYSCQDYKTADTCKYQSIGGPCFFDTSCKKITQCSEFTDPIECDVYKCQYEKKCRQKLCTDYKNESDCTYVKDPFSQTGTLCQWDKKCFDATDLSSFEIKTCNENTGNTYTWNSDQQKCIQCYQINNSNKTIGTINLALIQSLLIFFI